MIAWVRSLKTANHIFTLPSSQVAPSYRRVMQWYEAVDTAYLAALKEPLNKASNSVQLDSATARDIISNAVSKPTFKVQVDKTDPLCQAGWVKEGDWVSVPPNDTGKIPQLGILVGLTDQVVFLRVPIPEMEGLRTSQGLDIRSRKRMHALRNCKIWPIVNHSNASLPLP